MIDLLIYGACVLVCLTFFYFLLRPKQMCCKQKKLENCDDACDSCDVNKEQTIMMGGEEEDK